MYHKYIIIKSIYFKKRKQQRFSLNINCKIIDLNLN